MNRYPAYIVSPDLSFPSQECGVAWKASSSSIPGRTSLSVNAPWKLLGVASQLNCWPVRSVSDWDHWIVLPECKMVSTKDTYNGRSTVRHAPYEERTY